MPHLKVATMHLLQRIENIIRERTEKAEEIIKNTWNQMLTPTRELHPLMVDSQTPIITNYGLLKEGKNHGERLQLQKKILEIIGVGDVFKVWDPSHKRYVGTYLSFFDNKEIAWLG